MVWGWVGAVLGLPVALGLCAGLSAAAAVAVRPWQLDGTVPTAASGAPPIAVPLPRPEAPAAELTDLLHDRSGRVLELVRYRVDPAEREAFLTVMAEVRRVRLRSGALAWRLYEDVGIALGFHRSSRTAGSGRGQGPTQIAQDGRGLLRSGGGGSGQGVQGPVRAS